VQGGAETEDPEDLIDSRSSPAVLGRSGDSGEQKLVERVKRALECCASPEHNGRQEAVVRED
jgi:hypothetical protein